MYSDRDEWFKQDKENLGLDIPNLPYLIGPNIKLSETTAIMKYICYKHGPSLVGETAEEKACLDMLHNVAYDGYSAMVKLMY